MSESGDDKVSDQIKVPQKRMSERVTPPSLAETAHHEAPRPKATAETIFELERVLVSYNGLPAVRDITFPIHKHEITALIGPSGCGKTTLLRSLNRMNDLIPTARVEGKITYHGEDLYGPTVDPVQVRQRIGMVFQKPNPFPKSIYDNIAFGPKVIGMQPDSMDELVERSLRGAALWDEVKDKLKSSALAMSGGQQQRLCIARAIAVSPDVILMDEPCSSLDPMSTGRIEDLMEELKQDFTIVIVTHNMQQAARVSDDPNHAVVLVFVNQTVVVGTEAPTDTASSVRIGLDKIDGRWLISKFDPV